MFLSVNCSPSDIDIVVCSRKFPDARIPLFQLSPVIKQTGFAKNVQINRFAKIPVMIIQTTEEFGKSSLSILAVVAGNDLRYTGSFNIDISINHDDGTMAIEPINNFLATMPALRPLIMIVKGFLTQRGLNSAASSGLSSYAVICMVINFLQVRCAAYVARILILTVPMDEAQSQT
jgi:non-canonical poly(A) RNA polymerase PAPD5/7